MIKFCQRCQKSFVVEDSCTDFVHECNSRSDSLNNEDIDNSANSWTDYTGSGARISKLCYLGITNKLAGTRGHLQFKMRTTPITSKGNDAQTTRERQHHEYQEF